MTMHTSMKKAIAAGLIGLTALGGAGLTASDAFAQDAEAQEELSREERQERRAERRAARKQARAERKAALAEALGTDVDALTEALQNDQTIADIAEANGADLDAIIAQVVDAKTEKIQARVESGRLTQDEADEKIAGLEERVTEQVNTARSERDGHGRRGK